MPAKKWLSGKFLNPANILNELSKRLQGKAKTALQAIWMAETRAPERIRELFAGVIFVDGIPANETRQDPQQDAA